MFVFSFGERKIGEKRMKAQAFSLDLIAAVVIFFLVLGVYTAWRDSLFAKLAPQDEFQRMGLKDSEMAFVLLESPGDPADWNASTVKQVGLSFERNTVSRTRLANFLNLTYANATQLLRVGGYDFYFELRYLNGSIVGVNESGMAANATMGFNYSNYSIQIPLRRLVLFGGQKAVMLVRLAR